MPLESQIEAVLFYKAEPVELQELARFFDATEDDIRSALQLLEQRLAEGATRILVTDIAVQLVIAPEFAQVIEGLRRDELKRDIGKAGAETLAIVLYRGPISRSEIDRIRGVNSTFILRNLLVRGLIERRDNPQNARSYVYAITPDLLGHLGITKREELPDFTEIMNALDIYEKERLEIENEPATLT